MNFPKEQTYWEVSRAARNHFIRNAWEPIGIPRWALSLKYFLFIVVGILAFFTGVPSLNLTTFEGYEPIWSGIIGFAGLIGFVGSLRPSWRIVEASGGTILVAFLAVLSTSFYARGSLAVGLLLTIVTILPATRVGFLITRMVIRMPEGNHDDNR